MAVTTSEYRRVRIEDLQEPGMPDKLVEIIEGLLVKMTPADHFHNAIAFRLQRLFSDFADAHNLDVGYSDEGFLVERNPDVMFSPDAALFRKRDQLNTWLEFAPEIVVEVVSPSNSGAELAYKREKFFANGTEQFWLIYPRERRLEILFRDGRVTTATGDATVEGEGIASGMTVDLKELFRN